MKRRTTELAGWGRYPVVEANERVCEDLEGVSRNAVLLRGLGRSYGDASPPQRAGQVVAATIAADHLVSFDRQSGLLRAQAGFPLRELNRIFLARGAKMGRGILMRGRWAEAHEAPTREPQARRGPTVPCDLPIRGRETQGFVDALNEIVIEVGGRIYLTNDALTRPEHFRVMEPRLVPWLAVHDEWDPEHRFGSGLSARIFGDDES